MSLSELQLSVETNYGLSEEDRNLLSNTFKQIDSSNVGDDVLGETFRSLKERQIASELALASLSVAEGRASRESLVELYARLTDDETNSNPSTEEFVTDDLETLYKETWAAPGLRWRLDSLNKRLGSLRKGDFGFLMARPESYSRDTEVLTPNGWLTVDKVTTETEIAQVDEHRMLSFIRPTAVHSHEQEYCYHIHDTLGRVDLIVTEGHGMVVDNVGVLTKERADTVVYKQGVKHHVSAKTSAQSHKLNYMERLAIAYQADGHTRNYKKYGYSFSLKKERKINRLKEILNYLGWEYSEYKDGNKGNRGFYVKTLRPLLKDFSWVDLDCKSVEWCQEFIEELSYWDATRRTLTRFKFDTTNKQVADIVQAIAVMAGYNCLLSKFVDTRKDSYKDIYSLSIKTNYQPVDGQCIKKERISFTDTTYCFEVPTGMLLVRRNGAVAVCGNTGKTTFLTSEVSYMASQLKPGMGPILHFNNEEQGNKVKLRYFQATLGLTLTELMSNREVNQQKYLKETNEGQIQIYDNAEIHRNRVDAICANLRPSLIIFDQLDKIKGFAADREDLRLGAIYIWARELAKKYCPVIGICQADGTAEGVKYLTMDHAANAKCLSPDTKIVMYDGSLRKVGDIRVGEQVMGPDSTPRNVLDVSWGKSKMYSVHHNIGGDGYLVNKDHILSLIKSNNGAEQIVDIPIEEYLAIKCKKPYFGYRVGYELSHKYFSIDPYYLGLWLGDGKASAPEITTLEPEIKHYVLEYAEYLGCTYVEWQNGADNPNLVQAKIKYRQGVKHPLMEKLRELNLENNKHIPEQYFHGSMAQRRLLLAGLIDTDGTLIKRKHEYYSFTNKNKDIAFGVKRLALSVGMYSTCVRRGEYYYVHISGDLSTIPCLVTRKQSTYKPSRDVLRSSLSVYEIKDEMEYCGILIDGDHRFILENSIVTHNTAKQAEADFIIGIGCVHDPVFEFVRYINIPKNKLQGDEDTDPKLRHSRFECLIRPEIGRYEDYKK